MALQAGSGVRSRPWAGAGGALSAMLLGLSALALGLIRVGLDVDRVAFLEGRGVRGGPGTGGALSAMLRCLSGVGSVVLYLGLVAGRGGRSGPGPGETLSVVLLGLRLVILGLTGWGVGVGPGAGKALSTVLHGLPGLLLPRMVLGLGLVVLGLALLAVCRLSGETLSAMLSLLGGRAVRGGPRPRAGPDGTFSVVLQCLGLCRMGGCLSLVVLGLCR